MIFLLGRRVGVEIRTNFNVSNERRSSEIFRYGKTNRGFEKTKLHWSKNKKKKPRFLAVKTTKAFISYCRTALLVYYFITTSS